MTLVRRLAGFALATLIGLGSAQTATAQAHAPAMARGCAPHADGRVRVAASYPVLRHESRGAPTWIPAHQVEVTRHVWVPGRMVRTWVPPLMGTEYDACGRPRTVCVRPGHWRTVHEPGHFEERVERFWVAGRWERGARRR